MSMQPDDPETGEAQTHKNALCTPPSTLWFYPSSSPSLMFWGGLCARGHGSHIFFMAESLESTRLGGLRASPPSLSAKVQ